MVTVPHWPIPLGFKPIDLDLSRIRKVLKNLGNPQNSLPPVIHVAGTNGKGSTIAFMRAILEAAGYRVHVYTSPHLVNFNERIILAGMEITDTFLYDVLETCRQAAKDVPVTFFEGTTAAAFLAFSQTPADIILLETGLGGRLDATNVIDNPALTVITPISMDHMEFLGNNLTAIANEKAGILKPGVTCVVSAQSPEAAKAIAEKAALLRSPLLLQDKDWHIQAGTNTFVYHNEKESLELPFPSLPGIHQLINAGTAITALKALRGFKVDSHHIAHGLTHAKHLARLQHLTTGKWVELLPKHWELWLDGGHNPAGGEVLSDMASHWQDKPLYLICGMLQGKDSAGFFAPLRDKVHQLVCIPIPGDTHSIAPEALAKMAMNQGIPAICADNLANAIQHITASEPTPARILICGSLYLAGHVLAAN